MNDLLRLRFVTERYPNLQGLRLIPLGIPFLISALWRNRQVLGVPATDGRGATYWFFGLMVVALLAAWAVGRYYARHFGCVQPDRPARNLLASIGFLAIFLSAVWAQEQLQSGFSVPAVVIAIGLFYLGLQGQVRAHYLVVGGIALVFGALGAFGVPFQAREVLLDSIIGFGLIYVGISDHLLLRGTLQPVGNV